MAAPSGHRLLCCCQIGTSVSLLLLATLTFTSATRYGQGAQTLHVSKEFVGKALRRSPITIDVGKFKDFVFEEVESAVKRSEQPMDAPFLERSKRQTSSGSPAVNTGISATHFHLNDSHTQLIVHWAGEESPVILALARFNSDMGSSSLFISRDYGKSFASVQSQLGSNVSIHHYYNSPIHNSHYVFTDIRRNKIFTTRNFGRSFFSVSLSFTPRTVALHSTDPHIILAMDDKSRDKNLYISRNFGVTWSMIQPRVKSFFWGIDPYDSADTLYVERKEFNGDSIVIKTTNYFSSRDVLIRGVKDFEVRDNYMFATKQMFHWGPMVVRLQLYVSRNRGSFKQAKFPYEFSRSVHDYYIADASEDQVFVCVNHNHSLSHLYISDVEGINYSLSLERVLYFNPNGSNNDTWLRLYKDESFADIHKVDGLRGVYIASQLNDTRLSLESQKSLITFDKGGEWLRLVPPPADSSGNPTNCNRNSGCSLHLGQEFSKLYPGTKAVPILSKKSAPGLVIASGTLGKNMKRQPNVYLSNDAGLRWYEILKGNQFYAFGDHGGVIVAVSQFSMTKTITYSKDMGETWETFQFTPTPIRVYGLLTEPGEATMVFSVFGSHSGAHSWIIVQVNATNIFKTNCDVNSDYKQWSLSDDNLFQGCLLGRKTMFKRRIPHANCRNGPEYELMREESNCSCTRQDYECDFGFKKQGPYYSAGCIPDPQSNATGINLQPENCPPGTFYRFSKGYRKVSGDTCTGGEEHRFEALMYSCPTRRRSEFLLYSNRHQIHQLDMTNTSEDRVLIDQYLYNAVALEFDYADNCLYWADITQDVIKRVCLSGSNTELTTVVPDRLQTVEGLAYDWMGQNLYWVDAGYRKIEVARKDGRFRKVLIEGSKHLDKPRAIVVDPQNGYMYWSDWSDHARIMKAFMDGTESSIKSIVSGTTDVRWPNGLALDYQLGSLYWTDARLDRITKSDLNGGNKTILVRGATLVPHPYSISLYKGEMYWSDWSIKAILAADKFTGGGWHNVISVRNVMDIKILNQHSQNGNNPCSENNGGCSHLCLARPGGENKAAIRTCMCEEGHLLSTSGTSKDEHCLCPANEKMVNGTCIRADVNTTCAAHQLTCANNKCVPLTWKCDRDDDCGDGTDEQDCSYTDCAASMFRCANRRCITMNWRCDHDDDCHDGSDEVGCTYNKCSDSQFQCDNGRCILKRWKCDMDNDCHDGSDEKDCHIHRTCNPDQVPCNGTSNECIPRSWLCNGGVDCPNATDEQNCTNNTCSSYEFQCKDRKCIFNQFVCDGHNDCDDNSDEPPIHNCPITTSTNRPTTNTTDQSPYDCHSWQFGCRNGHCVWWSVKCDGINDCGDYSDEFNCGENTTTRYTTMTPAVRPGCGVHGFTCFDGQCLSESDVCDGVSDCSTGEDEDSCIHAHSCKRGYFMCKTVRRCIPDHDVCDGVRDCPDGSDEGHCRNSTSGCLQTWQLPCNDGDSCVAPYYMCDGSQQCGDGSDELHTCTTMMKVKLNQPTVTATSVTLSWRKPSSTRTFMYMASYLTYVGDHGQKNSTVTSKLEAEFTKLIPASHYTMFVYVQETIKEKTTVYYPGPPIEVHTLESKPECPDAVYVHHDYIDKELSVRVTWNEPTQTNGDLTMYKIYYKNAASGDVSHKLLHRSEFRDALRKNSQQAYSILLDELTMGQKYNIWVTAINRAGESEKCKSASILFGSGNIPLLNLTVNATTSNSVTLTWKASTEKYNYTITYKNIWFQAETQQTDKPPVTISNLNPGHLYSFMVRPHNSTEKGSIQFIKAQTKGTPIKAPDGLKVLYNGPTEVNLSWNYTGKQTFRVFYDYKERLPKLFAQRSKYIDSNANFVEIRDLLACETYSLAVAVAGKAKSPLSEFITLKTDTDRLAAPKDVTVKLAKNNETGCFQVFWEASCIFNMVPVSYWVETVEVFQGQKYPPSHHKVDGGNLTHINTTLCNATRGATYEVKVKTTLSQSRFSEVYNYTTETYKAPMNFKLDGEVDNNLRFSWNDSMEVLPKDHLYMFQYQMGNGDFKDYKVSKRHTIDFPESLMTGNQTYSFRIQLYINGYRGEYSNEFQFDEVTQSATAAASTSENTNLVAIVAPISAVVVILVIILLIYVVRHHRLQRSFLSFARSHYDTRSGTTTFTSDDLGEDEDSPMITGFSDDEPLVLA